MSENRVKHVLHVDNSRCCGYGICAELSPSVLSLSSDGFVVASTVDIPDVLVSATEDAVASCPERVLSLSRESS